MENNGKSEKRGRRSTEPENMACTWFGEICSCSCLTALPALPLSLRIIYISLSICLTEDSGGDNFPFRNCRFNLEKCEGVGDGGKLPSFPHRRRMIKEMLYTCTNWGVVKQWGIGYVTSDNSASEKIRILPIRPLTFTNTVYIYREKPRFQKHSQFRKCNCSFMLLCIALNCRGKLSRILHLLPQKIRI